MQDLLHREMTARPFLNALVAFGGVTALAGFVPLAAHQQHFFAICHMTAQRMLRLRVDKHPFGHRAVERHRHEVREVRLQAGEVKCLVVEGKVRRNDHVGGCHGAPIRLHLTGFAAVNVFGQGSLEDVAAVAVDLFGQRQQVFTRVEPGLVVKAHGSGDFKGQGRLGDELGGQAGVLCSTHLGLDLSDLVLTLCVCVRRSVVKITVDAIAINQLCHQFNRRLIGCAVGERGLCVKPLCQFGVDERVQRGQLGGGVGGDTFDNAIRFDHGHTLPHLLEEQRRRQAGDTAADNGDVHRHIIGQRRVVC